MSAVLQDVNTSTNPFTRKLSLHAMLPQQVLLGQLEGGLIASPSEAIPLLHAWEKANCAYANCGPPSRSFLTADDIRPIQGVEDSDQEETLRRLRMYPPFDSHRVSLCDVSVSKLVTPQITLNAVRAALRAAVRPAMTAADLLRVAFSASGHAEPVNRQTLSIGPNGGSVLFTSFDEDVRLHQPVYQDVRANGKDDKSALLPSMCLPVGGGLGFTYAFRIDVGSGVRRLILMNGIHRTYELAKAGFERVPVAVCDIQAMELPDQVVDLPKQMLLDPNINAPLLIDYLNHDVALELEYFKVLRTVRLNWNCEQYATVLR
jgi:hypothetical protein